MNTNSEEYKKQVYERWLASGKPWSNIDKSKEPTYAERQIIIEMKKRESDRIKSTSVWLDNRRKEFELEDKKKKLGTVQELSRLLRDY